MSTDLGVKPYPLGTYYLGHKFVKYYHISEDLEVSRELLHYYRRRFRGQTIITRYLLSILRIRKTKSVEPYMSTDLAVKKILII